MVQICSKTGERVWATHSLDAYSPVQCQWFRSAQKLTHKLDACSPILINGSDQLKNERATHKLDVCSPILISGFESLEDWRATHSLDVCSPLLVVLICSRSMTRERLTAWMHVHHLVSISDPLNYWRTTHSLHFILVSGSDLLKH